ncbi:uncharacterized protein BO96DRAFT_456817 [Aspergillus niger CBS 101883]|uniref:uncharacterized protein n=1 Tax=Aspergillus lacticoffeatus (strain CBS 101883) TaxID=1450533 RepID=UPI000D7EF9C1|nr:uncharacterized protein BO96DRAFT_456817 [Aspergillus niger CBS 101883]PYH56288.1 hypothetical protein BO96DRAFT_456817 [Aspergillus niger CBS 101883]
MKQRNEFGERIHGCYKGLVNASYLIRMVKSVSFRYVQGHTFEIYLTFLNRSNSILLDSIKKIIMAFAMSDRSVTGSSTPHPASAAEQLGDLLTINRDALTTLAVEVRRKQTIDTFTTASVLSCHKGSRNVIHVVEFDDQMRYIIRLPISCRPGHCTETAKRALVAKVEMMRFIQKRAHFPMPEVYDFDASPENILGTSYIIESFIPGTLVSDAWFDNSGTMTLDQKRLRILDCVAETMAKLHRFCFDGISTLGPDVHGDLRVLPCYYSRKGVGTDVQYAEYGPYESTVDFLRERLLISPGGTEEEGPFDVGCLIMLEMMIGCMPLSTSQKDEAAETFVLAVPQFDSVNIRIDEQCNVSGIIDWDGVQTMPRFLGYATFPKWIMRDMDPVERGWSLESQEDSAEQLRWYRLLYNRKMQGLLNGVGDARFVNKTHIFSSILLAIDNPAARKEIVRTLVGKVYPAKLEKATRLIEDAGNGELLRQDRERLLGGFGLLFSISR